MLKLNHKNNSNNMQCNFSSVKQKEDEYILNLKWTLTLELSQQIV